MKIDGIEVNDVKTIEINGHRIKRNAVEEIHLPASKAPFWQFDLKDSTTIYATGNITIHYS